jgi:peroxiredoxin family protein
LLAYVRLALGEVVAHLTYQGLQKLDPISNERSDVVSKSVEERGELVGCMDYFLQEMIERAESRSTATSVRRRKSVDEDLLD